MRRALPLMAALLLLLSACSSAPRASDTVFAMDTVMSLDIWGREEDLQAAEDLIRSLDASLSATAEGSDIYNLNASSAWDVSPDTARLISRALEICALTGGALDVTVYPAVLAWGFTIGDYRVPDKPELEKIAETVDYSAVELDGVSVKLPEGVMLDLGAVAKGWTGDRCAELLRSRGVESALLNLGGNVHALGSKPDGSPWRVGVRDPFGESYLLALEVRDCAVVTSGGYERYFEEGGVTYHHILDPDTCAPARSGLASVTVVGPEGVLCDGLSTALFVMGLDRAAALWRECEGFECVFVTDGGEVYITSGLASGATLADGYEDIELQVISRD